MRSQRNRNQVSKHKWKWSDLFQQVTPFPLCFYSFIVSLWLLFIIVKNVRNNPVKLSHKFFVSHHPFTSGDKIKFPCSSSLTLTKPVSLISWSRTYSRGNLTTVVPLISYILILIILRTLQKYLGIALPKKKYINYRTRIMAYG